MKITKQIIAGVIFLFLLTGCVSSSSENNSDVNSATDIANDADVVENTSEENTQSVIADGSIDVVMYEELLGTPIEEFLKKERYNGYTWVESDLVLVPETRGALATPDTLTVNGTEKAYWSPDFNARIVVQSGVIVGIQQRNLFHAGVGNVYQFLHNYLGGPARELLNHGPLLIKPQPPNNDNYFYRWVIKNAIIGVELPYFNKEDIPSDWKSANVGQSYYVIAR